MQKMPQSNMPNTQGQRDAAPHMSPAYTMAARIRNEQGKERAAEYLAAMEPFLAPGERAHIAAQLGVPLAQSAPPPADQGPPFQQQSQPFQQQGQPFQPQIPPIISQLVQNRGSMNDPMQMMQMLSGLRGMNGGEKGKTPDMGGLNNTLMLAQLLGMMGKK